MALPKLGQSGLLFVPHRFHRAGAIRWLKRIHAWTGFWGALLFLMLGVSGFLLNHRGVAKIETGEPVEVSAMAVAVAPGTITDADSLGAWAKRTFDLPTDPRPPRKEGGGEGRGPRGGGDGAMRGPRASGGDMPAAPVPAAPAISPPAISPPARAEQRIFMGQTLPAAQEWEMAFNHPNGRLTVRYTAGSSSVAVRQDANNVFALIKNLHRGGGMGIGWVLMLDSIAGALVAMSLTGFLLWSRLHGTRLAAGGIILTSIMLGIMAVWPYWLAI
ncbi:MAG: PepSY-associated TM helix domain-containing protein [Sphingopyxis sp.]